MNKEQVLSNARLVLPDRVLEGSLVIADGCIRQIDTGRFAGQRAIDCGGDYLLPGLIEMHTDNLEKYMVPRPGIYWPEPTAAIVAHDNQIFNAGITTVFDAVSLGFSDDRESRNRIMDTSIAAIQYGNEQNLLKADHFLHLRCELPSATVLESFHAHIKNPFLKLVSVMDHTPGQRQWRDLSQWRLYHRDEKWTEKEAQAVLDHKRTLQKIYGQHNRNNILESCKNHSLPVASHDDTTEEHAVEAQANGITIAEFPTTLEAAHKAKTVGMTTIMGSPNMVRGTSHSGNISARELADHNLLDGFSSDYMPISLLHAAFVLHRDMDAPLPEAIAKVTANIADMVHLKDRGRLEPNLKADILRVGVIDDLPVIKTIWKNGRRTLDIMTS